MDARAWPTEVWADYTPDQDGYYEWHFHEYVGSAITGDVVIRVDLATAAKLIQALTHAYQEAYAEVWNAEVEQAARRAQEDADAGR